VARAVPEGDRLCFRLVCRRWAAAGKAVAPGAGEARGCGWMEIQLPPGKVTWTSLLDMTASVTRVKMMRCVLKHSLILIERPTGDLKLTPKTFGKFFCAFLAGGGHLAVLK